MMTMEQFVSFDAFLTEEEKAIRDTLRAFVEEKYLPIIEKHHREGTFPTHLIPQLAELGVFGAFLSDYGLPGLSTVPYGLIMQELERGDSGLRSLVSVQNSLVIYPIFTFGSKDQKDYYIPKLASGEMIGCYGLTEPDFGSNPGAMRTRAYKVKGGWRIQGSKAWITNGSLADIAVVWAKDEEGKIRGFIIEKGTPGFETQEYKNKFSLRASDTSALFFHDCFVKADQCLPETYSLRHPFMCLNEARFGIAWGAIGSALACAEHALRYAKERLQFKGQPIASHQMVQEKLVFMVTEIAKAQTLMLHLSKLKDDKKLHFSMVSLAKRNNVWMARKVARLAREILGASGIVDDHPVIRHMMNLEAVFTYEGTHDIHTLIIGEHLTGIPSYNPPMKD